MILKKNIDFLIPGENGIAKIIDLRPSLTFKDLRKV